MIIIKPGGYHRNIYDNNLNLQVQPLGPGFGKCRKTGAFKQTPAEALRVWH
jgi:hypothetical protein